jgi:hypothetical protein
MKIVVIQRHVENLRGIKKGVAKINRARAEEILFTSSENEVLWAVRDGSPVFVVSGQVLDRGYGTDLAREVKRINPRALFFIYSVMPERNKSVDGIIPKRGGTAVSGEHSLLASILAADLNDKIFIENIRAACSVI